MVAIPPKITGTPRRRYASAISQPRLTWLVSIMEMATASGRSSRSSSCTFSSTKVTATSGGSAAAMTTGPWGGRWNSVWRISFGQRG
jgi:hypothetical protein